jgi:hypothetical protein
LKSSTSEALLYWVVLRNARKQTKNILSGIIFNSVLERQKCYFGGKNESLQLILLSHVPFAALTTDSEKDQNIFC